MSFTVRVLRNMVKKKLLMIIGVVVVIFLSLFLVQFFSEAAAANKLRITIEDIRLANIGLASCDLFVTVNLSNPTNQDLFISFASFDVFVAESYVGNSSISDVLIPKISSEEEAISLTLLYSDIAQAVLQGILNKNFDLAARGMAEARVFFGVFTVKVPFSISSSYS